MSIFEKSKQSPLTIFDVGANIENISNEYHTIFPNAEIYCFEPVPFTFSSLKNRFQDKKNIHCVNAACGESQKEVKIWETLMSGNSSLYKPSTYLTHSNNQSIASDVKIIGSHQISQIKLDDFCRKKIFRKLIL